MVREIQPSKITLHETSKWSKKTASQVRKATGADVVINGTLFDYGARSEERRVGKECRL